MENVRKHGDMNLVTTERRRNYQSQIVSEPNYHCKKFFAVNQLAIDMTKTEILTNEAVHLGLSVLELSKILMYEFWYDSVKPNYNETAILCYTDTDIKQLIFIKTLQKIFKLYLILRTMN